MLTSSRLRPLPAGYALALGMLVLGNVAAGIAETHQVSSSGPMRGRVSIGKGGAASPEQQVPTSQPTPVGPPTPTDRVRPDLFLKALAVGVAGAVGAFTALFAYSRLAPRLRNYAAYLKTRRLHRRAERQRRQGRRL